MAVLTGSTNFSDGGIFGQSNVVHVVDDKKTAAAYLAYVKLLAENPDHLELRQSLTDGLELPDFPPKGTRTIFSPRNDTDALEWYAHLASQAQQGLFMTFAFGMNAAFVDVYKNAQTPLRYALMENLLRPGVKKADKPAEEAKMIALRKLKANRFAVGSRIAETKFDHWVRETLTGLNGHVKYIHTKFMLIDPLSDDPIVISGSANFSIASSNANDENMLVIRGDKRVADIYLGEYMRLWNHYAFREAAAKNNEPVPKFRFLDESSRWWKIYFQDTDKSRQRQFFVGSSVETLA